MSWYKESKRTWFERFFVNVLKCGPIPKHVAFIMDGNRRYAVKNGMEKLQGHIFGFEKLSQTLEWCLDLGITEVTVYTFSIENFKRPEEEVNCLMNLAREKFKELLKERDKLDKYGVRIRIFGDITLLPVDLQQLIAEAVLYTHFNEKTYLNVCFAYTSREEMASAVKEIASEVVQNNLKPIDVTEELLDHALYSSESKDPDLVVRTSGEVRLSDFLLWQSSYSVLSFFNVLWPDFSIWHLFLAVLFYQYFTKNIQKIREYHRKEAQKWEEENDLAFARQVSNNQNQDQGDRSTEISQILNQQDIRRRTFVNDIHEKRYQGIARIKDGFTVQNKPPIS